MARIGQIQRVCVACLGGEAVHVVVSRLRSSDTGQINCKQIEASKSINVERK